MKRFLRTLAMAGLAASCALTAVSAIDTASPLRVGLLYGSTALPSPQLQNFTGSGYQLGYFDDASIFHNLLPVSQQKLVILKDASYAFGADNAYTESASGAIGAYHIELPQTYATATEAKLAASQQVGGFVAYIGGAFRVRTGSYTTLAAAQTLGGAGTAVGASPNGVTVVEVGTSNILFEYDDGQIFAIAPQGDAPLTWCKGYKYYGSFAYPRVSGGNLSVINYVALDDYVKGVLPYEMSADWHLEALKAQAVCARSYALAGLNKHKSQGFDLCNTTDCQVYKGSNLANDNSNSAVTQTSGEYTAVDGKVVSAFFFSSDGGATEDAANVWGTDVSYLKGVIDPYEKLEAGTNGIWTTTITASEATAMLNKAGYSIGTVTNLAVTKTTPTGNVLEVTATDSAGKTAIVTRAKCRSVFGVNSQRYTIVPNGVSAELPQAIMVKTALSTRTELGTSVLEGAKAGYNVKTANVPGTPNNPNTPNAPSTTASTAFTFSGRGWGHHVGMSQYGAKAMAEQGKTYRDILNFYYTGIEILK